MTCHPPVHLPAEAVRREGDGEAAVVMPRGAVMIGVRIAMITAVALCS
jgi:hypothetical protein